MKTWKRAIKEMVFSRNDEIKKHIDILHRLENPTKDDIHTCWYYINRELNDIEIILNLL